MTELPWIALAHRNSWAVQSHTTGRTFSGLPSQDAAEKLARNLTKLDTMLRQINRTALKETSL